MRTEDEIQRAHDQLVGILLGEVKLGLPSDLIGSISTAASVLCWILQHEHNQTFGKSLANLESLAKSAGYTLERYENPST